MANEKQIERFDFGPQYKGDNPFTARMRFHQSWYRANVLRVPCGTGPGPQHTGKFGNMLTREDGAKGSNFLTPDIFEVAKSRMKDEQGMVEKFRLRNNMLSSQPMCFNLFGPFVTSFNLARDVFKHLLPDEVEKITDVKIEYSPEPKEEYLDDRTAFDAFVEFLRPDGRFGFVGIETKLTEPFSQEYYDTPVYRRWTELKTSPWPKESWPYLDEKRHNQLWRDHLLTVALRNYPKPHLHPESLYASGFLMLVRHPEDEDCAEIVKNYTKLLKPGDNTFIDCSLDKLVDIMLKISSQRWVTEIKKRYLDLYLSEDDWLQSKKSK